MKLAKLLHLFSIFSKFL